MLKWCGPLSESYSVFSFTNIEAQSWTAVTDFTFFRLKSTTIPSSFWHESLVINMSWYDTYCWNVNMEFSLWHVQMLTCQRFAGTSTVYSGDRACLTTCQDVTIPSSPDGKVTIPVICRNVGMIKVKIRKYRKYRNGQCQHFTRVTGLLTQYYQYAYTCSKLHSNSPALLTHTLKKTCLIEDRLDVCVGGLQPAQVTDWGWKRERRSWGASQWAVLLHRGGGQEGVKWGNSHRMQVQVFPQLLSLKAPPATHTHTRVRSCKNESLPTPISRCWRSVKVSVCLGEISFPLMAEYLYLTV